MHAQNLSRSEAQRRAQIISNVSYEMFIDVRSAVEADCPHFGSETVIRFTASRAEDIFADYEAESVRRVVVNGVEQDLSEAVRPGRVHFRTEAGPNEVVIAGRSLYSRSGEGMHRYVDPADGETYLYTQYEPADCRRVFATFEQPDLKATYTLTLTGPRGWVLESNAPAAHREPFEDGDRVVFETTATFSTYITTILAGPYHVAEDLYTADLATPETPDAHDIRLRLFCRKAISDLLDADLIFEQTKKGLTYFQDLFGSAYPWGGKYDQAFVPEYNLGAMENPGLVTFTEEYLYRGEASELQIESRANTILHEMAHMWFGDLVTMHWWDDLWLKESFADYMGTLAVAEALDRPESWVTFANRRKAWAYVMDQGPTTHPIVADIPDLEAARQNFDGITYAKGASVLKQLVAHAGEEAFTRAARAYFARHAFGNARLADLLAALSESTGKDMSRWAALWLQTSGVSRLTLTLTPDTDRATIAKAVLSQSSTDPLTGISVVRPHTLALGRYELSGGSYQRTWSERVTLEGASLEIPELAGTPLPSEASFILVNDDDLTYATVQFDKRTLAVLVEHAHEIADPLAQAVVLSNLWEMVRAASLPAREFVRMALRVVASGAEIGLATVLLQRALVAARRYAPVHEREALFQEIADDAWRGLDSAETSSALATEYALAVAALARTTRTEDARALLAGEHTAPSLTMDEDVTWQLVAGLASAGLVDEDEIEARYAAKPSAAAERMRRQALAARPGAENKRRVWDEAWGDASLSNDAVSALAAGFARDEAKVLDPIRSGYADLLLGIWGSRSQEIASRLVGGFFPADLDVDTLGSHPFVSRMNEWMEANREAPAALRRLLSEHIHAAELQLAAQRRAKDGI
ncbi:aminopeptidase N [Falsarthrobacter nasiphocae]|uniref:Aminopeptidase N n=1 Tax=Falsarthrobacter nasiphocae TaxID=189863 RepID=A0AAE4C5J3_9MICC|nr:aminopeptidase N [Falsarthrobacter nasiphocae]MDR6891127.1 aminopeptidase N [Falsarthrobacter nasiphocae]